MIPGRIEAKGQGFDPKTMRADLKGDVNSFTYKNYRYTNMNLDGKINRGAYVVTLNSKDPNANLKLAASGVMNENKKGISSANDIAREIRRKIYEKTGLTASAGISVNKFLAKVASDYHKPNGQKTIHPTQILEFMEDLPIEKFYGIGKVTSNKMHELHIYKGADLKKKSLEELIRLFGKSGNYYYNVVRGVHHGEVKPFRIQKSVAVEETFWDNLLDEDAVFAQLKIISQELENRLSKKEIKGKTLTLKIKYKDFTQYTRSKTKEIYFQNSTEFYETAIKLWELRPFDKPVRLLGLSLSNLNTLEKKQVSVQLKIPFEEFMI